MGEGWRVRCRPPSGLVRPVPVDPLGVAGPTPGQARGRGWRRSSPGLYVPAEVPPQVEQRVLEASCRLRGAGAVTGWAALRLHGCGYLDGRDTDGRPLPVPLVVPPEVHLRTWPGTVVHRGRLPADEVGVRWGVPCTSPSRALFDAARTAPSVREAVVVVDTAAAAGVVDLASFATWAAQRQRWPGGAQVRQACSLAVERSLSPYETRLRLVWVLDAGYPTPLCNWPVTDADGRRLGRPDLVCPGLGTFGELDGADHRTGRQHAVDVARVGGVHRHRPRGVRRGRARRGPLPRAGGADARGGCAGAGQHSAAYLRPAARPGAAVRPTSGRERRAGVH